MTTLVVVAHPDDEILGAGIWMQRQSRDQLHILHITDGSPRDMENARQLGFPTAESYAAARRAELRQALGLIGVSPERCRQLSVPDKEAYLNLDEIIRHLQELTAKLRPSRILTSAYEGGHPDHDAAAFAVAAIKRNDGLFEHLEFPLYHADADGKMITGRFLEGAMSSTEEMFTLSASERHLKSTMLACFATQQEMLSNFAIDSECFRTAATYDFTQAPHPGPLLYETWGWEITGEKWRQQAAKQRIFRTGGDPGSR